jgi:hypothetical protein
MQGVLAGGRMAGNFASKYVDAKSDMVNNIKSLIGPGYIQGMWAFDLGNPYYPPPDIPAYSGTGTIISVAIGDNIETAIAGAAAGDTIQLAAGTYTVTDDIDITQPINVVGAGVGVTIIACSTASKNIFHVNTLGSVRISDLSIAATGNADMGINVTTADMLIDNCSISITGGAGTSVGIEASAGTMYLYNTTVSLTSTTGTIYGINFDTAIVATVVANCKSSAASSGAAASAIGFRSSCGDHVLYSCTFTGSGSATSKRGVLVIDGSAALGNCVCNGADYDVGQSATGTVALYNTTLVNRTTSGTITLAGEASTVYDLKTVDVGSKYPPAHSTTYVKATTSLTAANLYPYRATNPSLSLTGPVLTYCWMSSALATTSQRFHIDLGSAKVIKKIYYENFHTSGIDTNYGIKTFTFWGSNTASSFAELTYATDTGWTQLPCSQATFDEHAAADAVDPKYITVTNFTPYRYYAIKIADNWGSGTAMAVRRIELQTNDAAHDMTLTANAASLSPMYSGYAPALTMAGATTSWSVADDNDFSFGSGPGVDRPFTLLALVNPTSVAANTTIMAKDKLGQREYLFSLAVTGVLAGYLVAADGTYDGRVDLGASCANDVGTWHVYAMAVTGGTPQASIGIKLYRDGVQVDNVTSESGAFSGMTNGTSALDANTLAGEYANMKCSVNMIISRELSAAEIGTATDYLLRYVGARI